MPLGTSPSLANIGPAIKENASPTAAVFLNIGVTFLFREAGLPPLGGRRALARPAILWNPAIAAGLQKCEISVNAAAYMGTKLSNCDGRHLDWNHATPKRLLEFLFRFWRAAS